MSMTPTRPDGPGILAAADAIVARAAAPTPDPATLPTSAIRTRNLTKTYGTRNAVDGVSMEIPAGVVAGFVGPNGAGKTTTIRMLLALIRPTAGSVEVLGTPATRPADYLPRVGALIEGPAFYPGLSARRNLGGFSSARVGPLLAQVGLEGREGDAVKTYSLGMKQRLGIAAALLPNPALLILDEPTNGLDPAGILEIRHLIGQLKEQGVTILISSHLLAEVEQIADWIVLVNKGRVVYQGWPAYWPPNRARWWSAPPPSTTWRSSPPWPAHETIRANASRAACACWLRRASPASSIGGPWRPASCSRSCTRSTPAWRRRSSP